MPRHGYNVIVDGTMQESAMTREQEQKPTMFIGSSSEHKDIVKALQQGLEPVAEVHPWYSTFAPTSVTLSALTDKAAKVDFAALVVTRDDVVSRPGKAERHAARDNVIFELGLFLGALGARRTFVVYSLEDGPKLPTDLLGVTVLNYAPPPNGDWKVALADICEQIASIIRDVGQRIDHEAAEHGVSVHMQSRRAISALSVREPAFLHRYRALLAEMAELVAGSYALHTPAEVYQDDIDSMRRLTAEDEELLSTCPLPRPRKKAVKHIHSKWYKELTEGHKSAAERGLHVTRIFILPNAAVLDAEEIEDHLSKLAMHHEKLTVRVVCVSELAPEDRMDAVIFGHRKVSVGVFDSLSGQVLGATVFTQPAKLQTWKERFERLRKLSHTVEELLAQRA